MVPIKAVLTGLVGVSICMANISGIVTDTGTTPISGAVVQLEKGGQTATTGVDGSFTLTVNAAILCGNSTPLQNGLSAKITGNRLKMTIGKQSVVEVATFDLNGKALSQVRQSMDAGVHSIALPRRGAGIYLYKVKSNNGEFLLKGNSADGECFGGAQSPQSAPSNRLAKSAAAVSAINDVIAVTKSGYLNYRMAAYTVDTSGIAIKMIASAGTVKDTDGNVYRDGKNRNANLDG